MTAKTLGALALLLAALPVYLAATAVALLVGRLARDNQTPAAAPTPLTVMVSGGKMTKA